MPNTPAIPLPSIGRPKSTQSGRSAVALGTALHAPKRKLVTRNMTVRPSHP